MVRAIIFLFIHTGLYQFQMPLENDISDSVLITIPKLLTVRCPIPGALVTGSILLVIEDLCKKEGRGPPSTES